MSNHSCQTNACGNSDAGSFAKRTVGELVTENPSRTSVFEQFGIDFCCGGKISLSDACQRKQLDLPTVVQKLVEADSKGAADQENWTELSLALLITNIIKKHHQPLRQELPRIGQLATKVARVHGDNHPEMVKVSDIFDRFMNALLMHMDKEEMVLFPAIAAMERGEQVSVGCGGSIQMPIAVMTSEHDEAGEALSAMRKLTNEYTPPADACNSFRVLLHSLSEIEKDMHIHVHKENSVLFPRALDLLKTPAGS